MSDWISVDYCLPAEGQSVAFVVDCKGGPYEYLNRRVLGGVFSMVGRYPTFSTPGLGLAASHWMPLPDAPEAPQ
jgi:hypothetical protein